MADLNKESMAIWKSLKPMIDEEIKAQTRGSVQRRKMKVTTAPSLVTNVIGVTEPYGSEMFIPFNTNLSAAHIGDVVWVEFMYGATNAFASMYASADTKDWTVGGTLGVTGDTTLSGDLSVAGDESVTGDLTVSGDATLNGVLDVTKRRCSATLSSSGWYRVMTFEPTTNFAYADVDGSIGAIIPICVTRRYYWNGAETHKVDLLLVNGATKFSNESSTSSVLGVDKIRYTKDSSNKGYVDIHYALSQKNQVGFRFDVYSSLDPDGNSYQGQFTSASMASVADAPAGETVLTTFYFNYNTEGVTDGWHYTLQGKHLQATKTITDTLTNYTTINGFFGYYISNITTPFTMASAKYYVGTTWSIGSGFSISAGLLAQRINSFNAYALSTASGSQDVELSIVIEGDIA